MELNAMYLRTPSIDITSEGPTIVGWHYINVGHIERAFVNENFATIVTRDMTITVSNDNLASGPEQDAYLDVTEYLENYTWYAPEETSGPEGQKPESEGGSEATAVFERGSSQHQAERHSEGHSSENSERKEGRQVV